MKIIGHRGAKGLAPENTIASLQKALEHHVDELEFDLRVTKDEVVILHHNSYVTDPSGHKHSIKKATFNELLQHKADLTTLEKVLNEIGHPMPLLIEVKKREPVAPIIKIIKSYLKNGWKTEYFLLASKSQSTLHALHKSLPEVEKIVIEPWSGVRAHFRVRELGARRVSMNQRWLWWGFIRSVSHRDYNLAAYTLNDPKKAKRWQRHGLDAVITDYPDRFEHK